MNMLIFKRLLLILILALISTSCQKDDIVYDINQLQSSSYNANKNKQKSIGQYISIVYANLFQKALSSNELVEITRCIESIGDKQVAHEIVLSNFLNSESDGIITSSLFLIPIAFNAISKAAVPFETVVAYFLLIIFANFFSNLFISFPVELIQPDFTVL